MFRFVCGFAVALLINMPLSGQQRAALESAVHLNEHDVPWPELVTGDVDEIPPELRERQQELLGHVPVQPESARIRLHD